MDQLHLKDQPSVDLHANANVPNFDITKAKKRPVDPQQRDKVN